jgi:hypothetical protein
VGRPYYQKAAKNGGLSDNLYLRFFDKRSVA